MVQISRILLILHYPFKKNLLQNLYLPLCRVKLILENFMSGESQGTPPAPSKHHIIQMFSIVYVQNFMTKSFDGTLTWKFVLDPLASRTSSIPPSRYIE